MFTAYEKDFHFIMHGIEARDQNPIHSSIPTAAEKKNILGDLLENSNSNSRLYSVSASSSEICEEMCGEMDALYSLSLNFIHLDKCQRGFDIILCHAFAVFLVKPWLSE